MSTDTKKKSALAGLIAATVAIAATLGIYITVSSTSTVGNVSPTIIFSPVVNAQVNQTILINATVTDSDGIASIIWEQILGPKSNWTNVGDDLYFIPPVNGTYVFTLEAQDKKNEITTTSIPVKVGGNGTTPTPTPPPTPQPPHCNDNQIYNATTNKCDPKPTPTPPPTPTPTPTPSNQTVKVALTGDVESSTAGTAVFNSIKKENADHVIVLGDLGYQSSLSWFKSTYGTLGNKLNCVVGNHEAANEDGSAALEKETKQYCTDAYYFKTNHALFMGFNTNGDLTGQATAATKLLTDTNFMNGISSVHVMSHKPCFTPPNSHHTLEIKAFCDTIKSKIPSNVKQYYDQAHNHVMSATNDGIYKQIGAGGKSHYTCPTAAWAGWCDNAHYGYLLYTIKPDGSTTSSFKDYNGKELHQ